MWSGTEDDLPLQRVYRWERERAERIFLTQPYDHGKVRDWTWAQAVGDARRMAAYLQAQKWEPGSQIGILSKNCAWWIMADLAIWMAGHVSVPVYPSLKAESARDILTHSDSKACFIGPTDERETAKLGIPEGVLCIYFPNANPCHQPSWDAIMAGYSPVAGNPTRPADDIATVIYTSGTTGAPKGAMHRFGSFSFLAERVKQALGLTSEDRVLSYLPLAHIVERTGFEGPCLIVGMHMFFTEGLRHLCHRSERARLDYLPLRPAPARQVSGRSVRQNSQAEARPAVSRSDPEPLYQKEDSAPTWARQRSPRPLRLGAAARRAPALASQARAGTR